MEKQRDSEMALSVSLPADSRRRKRASRLSVGATSELSRIRRSLVEAGLDVVTGEILIVEEGEGDGIVAAPVSETSVESGRECLSRAALFVFFAGFLLFFSLAAGLVIFLVVKKREKSALQSFVANQPSIPNIFN